ncbi:hypothetical protein LTR10_011122 [Elasticomyces elasticus]|nr:hypothetical protein LTR10_011122 [Elasticomyces elasticus]KAK4966457.1 hypothetical protein LTR42_011622 [Elasticomyces elasticus]
MQVLYAPTRPEFDRAYADRRFLDIGVHTLRNLASIDRRRLALWAVLGLSSVPLHLLYNSVVFEISTRSTFTVTTADMGGLVRLDNAACIAAYGYGMTCQYANLLAVSSETSERTTNNNFLNYVKVDAGDTTWMCNVPGNTGYQPPYDPLSLLANAAA